MLNNKAKCYLSEIFSNSFNLKDNAFNQQNLNIASAQRTIINPNKFKSKDYILFEEEKYEDIFFHKVNLN
jgi:hypothetical protein